MLEIIEVDANKHLKLYCDFETMEGIIKQLNLRIDDMFFIDDGDPDDYCGYYISDEQFLSLWIRENSETELRLNAVGGEEWLKKFIKK